MGVLKRPTSLELTLPHPPATHIRRSSHPNILRGCATLDVGGWGIIYHTSQEVT